MSDTQNEPLPGEKAIKVKKAGPILLGADRYDTFEKGQKAIREFVEELALLGTMWPLLGALRPMMSITELY